MTITCGSIATFLVIALLGPVSRAQDVSNPVQTEDKVESPATHQTQSTPPSNGVRIVRLSQVNGAVQLDRKTDKGFETAFTNLPIVQDQRLQTHDGLAEVEFEDNSTIRLTPNTLIEFPALQRTPSGTTITKVKILSGTLYASLSNTKGSEFSVTAGNHTITLPPSSHVRLDLDNSKAKLTVFNGSAQVTDESGTASVSKKKTLTFDAADTTTPVVASNEPGPFDNWDKNSAEYHNLRSVPAAYGGGSSLYGINDLNYYGSFSNAAGCGAMWRPYLASAGWDPFANGVWAWYPGAGYSWVSPYPWGWTPFHSGSWAYCPGAGWGWQPGSQWNGLQNQPMNLNTTKCTTCPKPPMPPVAGRSTLVVVNTKPLSVSKLASPDTFVFRNDSAGLGVPRESLGKLNKISAGVAQHGTVSTPVLVTNPTAVSNTNMRANNPGAPSRTADVQNRSNSAPTRVSQAPGSPASTRVGQAPGSPGSAPAASRVSSGSPSTGAWSGGSRSSSPGPSSNSTPAHH